MSYQMRRSSNVITFYATIEGYIFLTNSILRVKSELINHIGALTIERS